jgi:hypothetical protein
MNGVFYVATGEGFRAEAVKSAKSLKQHHPNLHTTLFSDQPCPEAFFDRNIIIRNPRMSNQDKMDCFPLVDYEKAIYLDTDTYVAGDISDLFTLLENFDMAAAICPMRGYWYHDGGLPDSFPEVNGGVIAFRNSTRTKKLFADWARCFEESKDWQSRNPYAFGIGRTWDQPGLRRALYLAKDIRLAILPTEYNFMRVNGTYLWGKAKILHGRGNIETVAERINRVCNMERTFLQGIGVMADFARLPASQVLEIAFRVNACAFLNMAHRLRGILRR